MKQILTAEEIAEKTDDKEGVSNIRAINKLYRNQDESHCYPVNNQFDATERAIRRVRKMCQYTDAIYGIEYCYAIENELSKIINDPIL